MSEEFRTIGVVGLGLLGLRAVDFALRTGARVVAIDPDHAGPPGSALPAEVVLGISFASLADADLVIETVGESVADKHAVLAAIEAVCPASTVIATTAAALPVAIVADWAAEPRRVLGLQLFPTGRLVGVGRGPASAAESVAAVAALVKQAGRLPLVADTQHGFPGVRLLLAYLNEAVHRAAEGDVGYAALDTAMRLGCGLATGPLRALDEIGLDVAVEALDASHALTGDPTYAAAPLLRRLAAAGDRFHPATATGGLPVASSAQPVRRVGVVGSGIMAVGAAEALARAGLATVLVARSPVGLDRAVSALLAAATEGRESGAASWLGNWRGTTEMTELADCALVIEAVVEDVEVKRAIFAELDRVCRPDAILATTTSSLSVRDCAAATDRPRQVVGLHLFNPVPSMDLVELVHTDAVAPETLATARALVERLGKLPVDCADRAGFIVNRILFPYLNSAARALGAGELTINEADTVLRLGYGLPMGPFRLLDVVGADVALAVQESLHADTDRPELEPAPLLTGLVETGCVGRKAGRGVREFLRDARTPSSTAAS